MNFFEGVGYITILWIVLTGTVRIVCMTRCALQEKSWLWFIVLSILSMTGTFACGLMLFAPLAEFI